MITNHKNKWLWNTDDMWFMIYLYSYLITPFSRGNQGRGSKQSYSERIGRKWYHWYLSSWHNVEKFRKRNWTWHSREQILLNSSVAVERCVLFFQKKKTKLLSNWFHRTLSWALFWKEACWGLRKGPSLPSSTRISFNVWFIITKQRV